MNVVELPSHKQAVAKELHTLASAIEAGEEDAIRAIVVTESTGGHVSVHCFGYPSTNAHAAGLLVASQIHLMSPDQK